MGCDGKRYVVRCIGGSGRCDKGIRLQRLSGRISSG